MPENNIPNGAAGFPGHGGLAPTYMPNPTQLPSNLGGMLPIQQAQLPPSLGGMLPIQQPQPLELGFAEEPKDILSPRLVPRTGLTITPSTGRYADVTPATITPATITPATVGYAEGTDADGNYISPIGQKFAPDGSPISIKDANTPVNTPPTTLPQTTPGLTQLAQAIAIF